MAVIGDPVSGAVAAAYGEYDTCILESWKTLGQPDNILNIFFKGVV